MKIKTPAKLNIGLDIVGLREDGYHLLDTVMQTVNIYDELEFIPREDGKVVLECDSAFVPVDGESLVEKAVRALTDRGMTIRMRCSIPSRAGMGAGSSDAAATLKAVNEIYALGRTDAELEAIGAKLGADVPFFIKGGRQRCEGIGEILTVLPETEEYYLVIKPQDEAITKDIFRKYDAWKDAITKQSVVPEKLTVSDAMKAWSVPFPDTAGGASESDPVTSYINVLEPVTAAEHPVIYEIKKRLLEQGARLASMTGSGTAVFGIFDSKEAAEKCRKEIGEGIVCQAC